MKPLKLTTTQVKALSNGATLLALPITDNLDSVELISTKDYSWDRFIENNSPVQIGDTVFVQEKFYSPAEYEGVVYSSGLCPQFLIGNMEKQSASKMTQQQQSRFNLEILDVKVVRVHSMEYEEYVSMTTVYPKAPVVFSRYFDTQMLEQEQQHFEETGEKILLPRYGDNAFIFLISIKQVECND